ncbi:MAG: TIGR04282 family arsenosugar biosynthesis glycosyltransferase [Lewinellaceae bacterium]|nr:TIGR04282 family arsenosugar biosynthesis glycosyltransferase [Lewinellaceae bacterium]
MSRALILFIKNPRLGKVKTRLAATMGAEKALRVYEAMLAHTRKVALQIPVDRYLYYSDFIDHQDNWSRAHFHKKVQRGENLGARMAHAFSEVLDEHERAILIGSDIPQINPSILKEAFERLSTHDFVIGPAQDGGYYLLGMRSFEPTVFLGIAWSAPTVFNKTIDIIQRLDKSFHCLPTLSDVDEEEDWDRLKKYLEQ